MARRQLLGLAALCLGLPARGADDVEAMIQTDVKASSQRANFSFDVRAPLRAAMASELTRGGVASRFSCVKYPQFCLAPFNCQEGTASLTRSVAQGGRANLNAWCNAPEYYDYITTCAQKKDLKKAAKIQYEWSINRGSGTNEMDGSYCFLEGHCSNEAVHANTTLQEAEKMCDDRYGHDGWADWSPLEEPRAIMSGVLGHHISFDERTGFKDRKLTRVLMKLACAMGNYHCDVMYCKETYCKKEYYINKYKHLEPKTPGHQLKQHFGRVFNSVL